MTKTKTLKTVRPNNSLKPLATEQLAKITGGFEGGGGIGIYKIGGP